MKRGYYWVKLHPIYEELEWTIGFWDGSNNWYLGNIEGDCTNDIDEIGDYIEQKK